jgi:hypothetical protein
MRELAQVAPEERRPRWDGGRQLWLERRLVQR